MKTFPSEQWLAIYQHRRAQLCAQLDNDSIVIIAGNTEKVRSKNIHYHFRADNDVNYLTGFAEPDAVLVIKPNESEEFVLFVRPKDSAAEVNFGERAGVEGAQEIFAADKAYSIDDLARYLPEMLLGRNKVYFHDEQGRFQQQIFTWIAQQRKTTAFDVIKEYRQLLPLAPILHQQRRIKSEEELSLIRHAVAATVHGHQRVMKAAKTAHNELTLAAEFSRAIADMGCAETAYPSIVASGNNACCLHYQDNNAPLTTGELLLIDAGAEYQHYCSDVTRTWPINGKFSNEQKALYNIVLEALDNAIAKIKPGVSWHDIYQTCVTTMAKGLLELGILQGTLAEVLAEESYRQFTVHKTGHWLGMDVHDVGSYHDDNGDWVTLATNMVFTIEPGIYIPESCVSVDKKWRGIGIRIEDDILVTANGAENLSADVPRTVDVIERFMKS